MIVVLTQEERRALLKAVGCGKFDTAALPRVAVLGNELSYLTDEELNDRIKELRRKLDIQEAPRGMEDCPSDRKGGVNDERRG